MAMPCYNARMFSKDEHLSFSQRPEAHSRGFRIRTAAIMLLAACALIAFGILGGAFADVWQRAGMVCYECIGIG